MAGTAIVSAGIGVAKAIGAGKRKRAAEREAARARAEKEQHKAAFSRLDTSNPFLNMENTMEDLTVNQQQAQFEAQQNQQQQANILGGLRESAGGSGIAALAQQMATSGQLASQRAAASIGAQESLNQRLTAQQAAVIQNKEREGEVQSRNWERDKTTTLLGMAQGEQAGYLNRAAGFDKAKWEGISQATSAATSYGQSDEFKALIGK
jgi:hypothetical protein